MKQTVNERFRKVVADNGFSATYLAKVSGISQTTISRQIKGDYNVSIESVNAVLHELPNLSADWLLTGRGSMYIQNNLPPMTGKESEESLDLHAQIAKLTAELEKTRSELSRANRLIDNLQFALEMQRGLTHEAHEDYIEEKQKKEIV